jgi:hypothetical protein
VQAQPCTRRWQPPSWTTSLAESATCRSATTAACSPEERRSACAWRAPLAQQHVRLVVLDEALRGLDRTQRTRLLDRARRHWSNATLLCATHDLRDAAGFDRVLVIAEGRVVEDGDPRRSLPIPAPGSARCWTRRRRSTQISTAPPGGAGCTSRREGCGSSRRTRRCAWTRPPALNPDRRRRPGPAGRGSRAACCWRTWPPRWHGWWRSSPPGSSSPARSRTATCPPQA